ncbi:MAG TPA: hypothetical protein PK307_05300 [Spirochaetota bacterium]|nr:hypothetical protein [Spirochaetota bacterium]HOD13931.1 hypothetical protein [Spirochaetota bacterium]HPG49787.1 hypothetical protein [Spirochaetota bacterium]HPN11229.1 hypothetical protein [Spirochaetota bacterium]HQL81595.1 hypothetical protein [Spirochaetota bacterium]
MAKIDYMKVVGVLGRTLKLETVDMKFQDATSDRLEITMGGPSIPEKKVLLSIADFSIELSFSADYLQGRDFQKWLSSFEYELEQAFVTNVDLHVNSDASKHVIRVTL